MIDATANHRQAMDLADQGDRLRRAGDLTRAVVVFQQAFKLERDAALSVEVEPSRSILHKSAAWLALEAGEARSAEMMAARGLAAPEVPDDIAIELRAVLEDAQLRLHKPDLPAPGGSAIFEMTMKGGDVGYGDASPDEVIRRIELGQKLIHRTVERRNHRPFRRGGCVPRDIVKRTSPRLRVAAGSFTIRFELGGAQLAFWEEATEVVEDIIGCLQAIANDDDDELERLITDPSYLQNFAAIARGLAPDGREVTQLAIAGQTKAGVSRLVLKRRRPQAQRKGAGGGERIEVVGDLLAADGTTRQSKITLVPADGGKKLSVAVADALLEDIVRPHFGRRVRAVLDKRQTRSGQVKYRLTSLEEADPEFAAAGNVGEVNE